MAESHPIKYLDPQKFIDQGCVHEINRLVLHPLGLALAVTPLADDGGGFHAYVWDCRDDEEGVYYGEDTLSLEKARTVLGEVMERRAARIRKLGYVVQPFPEEQVLTTNYTSPDQAGAALRNSMMQFEGQE